MFLDFTNAPDVRRRPWAIVQLRPSNAAEKAMAVVAARQDQLLDRALADTFPASDPVTASHVD
jgi:hypothetical protein